MNIAFTPEKARHQSAARVRQFHRRLIDAGLDTPPVPPSASSAQGGKSLLSLLGARETTVAADWVDMTGAFGRRRQIADVAPPTLLERLRAMRVLFG